MAVCGRYRRSAVSDRCPQSIVHRAGPELGGNTGIQGNRLGRRRDCHRFAAGGYLGCEPGPKQRHPARRLQSNARLGLRSRPSGGAGTNHRESGQCHRVQHQRHPRPCHHHVPQSEQSEHDPYPVPDLTGTKGPGTNRYGNVRYHARRDQLESHTAERFRNKVVWRYEAITPMKPATPPVADPASGAPSGAGRQERCLPA